MKVSNAVQTLREEHEEISRFLAAFEEALQSAASGQDDARGAGLAKLREMTMQGTHIRECCRHDVEALNSSLYLLADETDWNLWRTSVYRLERASYDFRKELGFATTLSTEALLGFGRTLVATYRRHMDYEEELLRRIATAAAQDSLPLGLKE